MSVLHFGLYMVEHFILPIPRAGSTAVGHLSRYQSGQRATAYADIKNAVKYFTGDMVEHFISPTPLAVLTAVGHFPDISLGFALPPMLISETQRNILLESAVLTAY